MSENSLYCNFLIVISFAFAAVNIQALEVMHNVWVVALFLFHVVSFLENIFFINYLKIF